ncbi:MAG: hypothetical protein JW797_06810 [Bradymonadales bacterium]|nr:hypothetical protein [Bradymonadales bacterium]
MIEIITVVTAGVLVLLFILWRTLVVVPERENAIKERLGKYRQTFGPGLHFLIPFVDRIAYRHEMREQVIDIPSQSCITRDNIQVEVDGIVYLKVVNAGKASYGIEDYRKASINLAQTTMRSEIGKLTLDETFTERERVNDNIVREIDKASEPWGIKMIRYEIRNITPSQRVIDTMEKQMEAERQKRADITLSNGMKEAQIYLSEGERQESINLSEGERQRRINEANGRAAEIRALAEASAQGIALIAEATRQEKGAEALEAGLVELFIEEFGRIVANANVSVLPLQLAQLKGLVEGLYTVGKTVPKVS